MNKFYFTTMKPQFDLLSFVFFEDIEDTKKNVSKLTDL